MSNKVVFKIKFDKKDVIKDMFQRTLIQQKYKIESNKKFYNKKDKSWKNEEI